MLVTVWTVLSVWIGSAAAAGPVDGEALRRQVEAWIDLEQHSRALALSRRGIARHRDDPRWHDVRLQALAAAGLEPWIEAEYAHTTHEASSLAWWRFALRTGRLQAVPDTVDPAVQALLAAERAVASGDLEDARAQIDALPPSGVRRRLAILWRARHGDEEGVVATLGGWPDERGAPPELWTALDTAGWSGGGRRRLERLERKTVDGWIAAADPVSLHRAAAWARVRRDHDIAAASAAGLARLATADGVAGLMDAITAMEEGFDAWASAPTPVRSRADLDALARKVAGGRSSAPSDLRPSEREVLGRLVARRLKTPPVPVRSSACRDLGEADDAWRAGDRLNARTLAEDAVLRCVGGLDLVPDEDPVGLDVDGRIAEVAEAWRRFGVRVLALGHAKDAAIALAVAARLAPDPTVLKAARAAGIEAGRTTLDALADEASLIEALRTSSWLEPSAAVRRSRGHRVRVRTIALLDPTVQHLADRTTPQRACVYTLRERCMLEHAVVSAAAAGGPVPEDVMSPVGDRGAVAAADAWWRVLQQQRLQRSAALAQALKAVDGAPDLTEVLSGQAGLAVGRRAPRFSVGGRSDESLRGQVVVLVFWATWSPSSMASLPVYDALAARWTEDGVPARLFAVGVDRDEASYRRAVATMAWRVMDVARDPELRRVFQADRIPTVVLVGAEGVLRGLDVGGAELAPAALDAQVRAWRPR